MADSVTLRIRRVKCQDETGGSFREKFGNDEIKCAVFSADLRGSTKNSGHIDIYNNFDDGDEKTFDPPKEVVTLDLAGATGEVEVAFSVMLIESQLTEGESLQKAWEAWVKVYEDALKEELSKRELTPERAYTVAQPGYLSPPRQVTGRGPREDVLGGRGTLGASDGGSAATAAGAPDNDTDLMDPTGEGKKEEEKHQVGDAFLAALGVAAAIFVVKFGGWMVGGLLGITRDKVFPPVALKAKIMTSVSSETVPPNATGVLEFRAHNGLYEMEWDIVVRG